MDKARDFTSVEEIVEALLAPSKPAKREIQPPSQTGDAIAERVIQRLEENGPNERTAARS